MKQMKMNNSKTQYGKSEVRTVMGGHFGRNDLYRMQTPHRGPRIMAMVLMAVLAFMVMAAAAPADAAIELRGISSPASANSGNVSVSRPSGTMQDDIMVMAVTTYDNVSISLPTGWTKFSEQNNGSRLRSTLAWKRAGSSEPSSYSISHSNGSTIVAGIASFSGCITSGSPIDVLSLRSNSSSSTVTANSITTTVANAMVIFTSHLDNDRSHSNWSASNPSTFTEAFDYDVNLSGDVTVALAYAIRSTSGSTGTATARLNNSASSNGILFALKPAPEAAAGTIQLSSATYSVGEGAGTVTITATRAGGSSGAVGVSYATSNGTATAGSDYTSTSGTLSWASGDTANKTFTVTILNDTAVEGNETFNVTLTSPTGGATLGSPSSAVVTITDDEIGVNVGNGTNPSNSTAVSNQDDIPINSFTMVTSSGTATVTGVHVSHTNPGNTSQMRLYRDLGTIGALDGADVLIATDNSTNSVDFTGLTETITTTTSNYLLVVRIANNPTPGQTTTAAVSSLDVAAPAQQGTISDTGATITIAAPAGTIQLSSATYSVGEGAGTVTITATRTGGSSGSVGVSYATSNGTATAGSDYTSTSGTLSWASGDTANKTFTVTILNDTAVEGNETFNVTLTSPTGGATLGSPSSAVVTIVDDDTAPAGTIQLSSATYSVGEGAGTVTITATRTGGSSGSVGVSYATSNGTATAGSDYTSTSGTLSWASGDTANKTFTVTILNDTAVEGNETFNVTLTSPTGGATLGSPSSAVVTIVDDDTAPPATGYSITTCNDCHRTIPLDASPQRGTPATAVIGSHSVHAGVLGGSASCNACHINNSTNLAHRNGLIQMASPLAGQTGSSYSKGASFPMVNDLNGTGLGTCSSTYCHGSASTTPRWGMNTGQVGTCNLCHGMVGTNPPRDTEGHTAVTDPQVGTHNAHLNATHNFSQRIACTECHTVPASVSSPGHYDTARPAELIFGTLARTGGLTPSYSAGRCSSTWCHGAGLSDGDRPPTWNAPLFTGNKTNDCSRCHGYPPLTIPEHVGLDVNRNGECAGCHDNVNATNDGFIDSTQHVNGRVEGGSCLACHSTPKGSRAAVVGQFSSNSHHIQGVALTNEHCYQCHWEANMDGSVNSSYHGGSAQPGSVVNLVVYGSTSRPTTYTLNTTAIAYTSNGTRTEHQKLNQHCLSCHDDDTATAQPFGDGKTPRQYAWDGSSVANRYSQTGTTTWGKYTNTTTYPNAATKNVTKAYSAHGNAGSNARGWNTTTGYDTTPPNTSGSVNVLCFDCHNSHGSSVAGTTTSYASSGSNWTKGGILKDTTAGFGGYTVTYRPADNATTNASRVRHSAGADLCFDCHLTSSATGGTPWSYNGTFGSTQVIEGYLGKPGWTGAAGVNPAGAQQRYAYKNKVGSKGSHFESSAAMMTSPMGTINGLCTPCHDPHGVTNNTTRISATNKPYAVPLLKGTWMTSPYKEDAAPLEMNLPTGYSRKSDSEAFRNPYNRRSTPGYKIDQNTFTSTNLSANPPDWLWDITAGHAQPNEPVSQFGGLCLNCHTQAQLNPNTTTTWKSMDRIHNTVKGWGGTGANANNAVHAFTCSKCHTPHHSSLPRLMVTNCLDYPHRGRVGQGGPLGQSPANSGRDGAGWGRFPGGGGGHGNEPQLNGRYYFGEMCPDGVSSRCADTPTFPPLIQCHNVGTAGGTNYPSSQLWNIKTPWAAP